MGKLILTWFGFQSNRPPSSRSNAIGVHFFRGNYKLQWEDGPKTVLIIKKPHDEQTDKTLVEVASWIHEKYPHMNVVVEPDVAQEFAEKLPFVYVIPGTFNILVHIFLICHVPDFFV